MAKNYHQNDPALTREVARYYW